MRVAVPMLVCAVLLAPAAASAQNSDPPPQRDGGLRVSGGTFGAIGGSGSFSGTVRGPGASGAVKPSAPAVVPASPSALSDGVVTRSELPVVEPEARPVGSSALAPGMLLLGVVAVTAFAVGFGSRGLPRLT